MKLTFRLMQVILPVAGLCAVMAGTAAAHTTMSMTSARQHVQPGVHTVRPNDIPEHITAPYANLYACLPSSQGSCSIITQLTPSDSISVHCQVGVGDGYWSYAYASDYGSWGWVSNDSISNGSQALPGVATCKQH